MSRLLQFIILLIISIHSAFSQCIVCKSSVESAAQESMEQVAKGVNTGILYLLPIPYLLVAGIGLWWYFNYKKQKRST